MPRDEVAEVPASGVDIRNWSPQARAQLISVMGETTFYLDVGVVASDAAHPVANAVSAIHAARRDPLRFIPEID